MTDIPPDRHFEENTMIHRPPEIEIQLCYCNLMTDGEF